MTQHIGIVWNPSKGPKEDLERALEQALERTGLSPAVTWAETEEDDPGKSAAKTVLDAGAEVVIAAGGDGTVRAVAEYLGETDGSAELAIAPLGTGNLLARNLGIPLSDLAGAFERALTGESQPIDLAWAEVEIAVGEDDEQDGGVETQKHAFAVIAGFGIDAHMITETNDDLKEKAGWLAYVESLGRAVSASAPVDIALTLNEEEPEESRAHTLMVGNCGTLQGGLTLLPAADPADGELDLLVLGAESVGGWLDTMRNMVWDNGIMRFFSKGESEAVSSDSTTHERFTRLELELGEPRVFEVDGDDIGETSRVVFTVQPGAVRVK